MSHAARPPATAARAPRTALTGGRGPLLVLIACGAGWGLTQPLSKIAVSGGLAPSGILVWQAGLAALLLGGLCGLRGRGLPLHPGALVRYGVIALIGSFLPGLASYTAVAHLPSGWMSVLLSAVPILAFPMALALGQDRFSAARLIGLVAGMGGVVLLVAGQGGAASSLLERPLPWVLLGLVPALLYAAEGNYVARVGRGGLDPFQLLCGASIVSAGLALMLALAQGTMIDPRAGLGPAHLAVLGAAVMNAAVYSGYVWLVGRAGSVFAAQVSYLVTGFGVAAAMAILGESYGRGFWWGLGLMVLGLALVQPRPPRSP